jgi:hypothetical protein
MLAHPSLSNLTHFGTTLIIGVKTQRSKKTDFSCRLQTLTLLCSSACTDEARCHRTLLRELIESAANE